LEARRATVTAATETVASERESLAEMARAQEATAADYAEGLSYERLLALVGADEKPGRLQELDTLLTEPIPPISGVNLFRIKSLRRDLRSKQNDVVRLTETLSSRAIQISYRDLFSALVPFVADRRNEAGDDRLIGATFRWSKKASQRT
jgi:hypothetical protein